MVIVALTDLRQRSERAYMPLLPSLADRLACVAINMALLTELSAWPSLLCRVRDACKVKPPDAPGRGASPVGSFASNLPLPFLKE